MRNHNHLRSSYKIWGQERRLLHQKVVIFPSFSSVIMNFFSPIGLISFIDSLHQKNSKSLVLEVAKVLKLTLFSVRFLKSLTPAFSQIFPVPPIFFKIVTTSFNFPQCLLGWEFRQKFHFPAFFFGDHDFFY